jgi:hypothetical protein
MRAARFSIVSSFAVSPVGITFTDRGFIIHEFTTRLLFWLMMSVWPCAAVAVAAFYTRDATHPVPKGLAAGLGVVVAWLAWAWEQQRSWSHRLNQPWGQYLLLLLELGMSIYLYSSSTDTEAARWAFDIMATVGVAGAMSRYARLRRSSLNA